MKTEVLVMEREPVCVMSPYLQWWTFPLFPASCIVMGEYGPFHQQSPDPGVGGLLTPQWQVVAPPRGGRALSGLNMEELEMAGCGTLLVAQFLRLENVPCRHLQCHCRNITA